MHRLLLVAVVVGTQFAAGCSCYGPYLPRLQSGWGCGTGACGGPILNRPVLNRPVLDRPILRPLAVGPVYSTGPVVGAPLAYASPVPPTGGPGCVGCESGGPGYPVSAGYPGGPTDGPLPTIVPGDYPVQGHGLPYSPVPYTTTPGLPGYPGTPAVPGPMPMVMPSALPGGVPHDSALLKMPTIMPPGPTSESKRPAELARTMSPAK